MKSAGLLTTLTVLLQLQILYGQQQNGFPNNQNLEANNVISQQIQTNSINGFQRLLNQIDNPGPLPNQLNQNQMQMQLSLVPSLSIPHQIDPRTEGQQQTLPRSPGLQQPLIQQKPTAQENVNLVQPSIAQQQINNNQSPPNIQPLSFQAFNVQPNFQALIPQANNQPLNSQSNIQQINSQAGLQQISPQPNLQAINPQLNFQTISSQPNFQATNSQLTPQATNLQSNNQPITFQSNLQNINSQSNIPPIGPQLNLQQVSSQPNIQPYNLPSNINFGQLAAAENVNWHSQQNPISIAADINYYPLRAPENRDQSPIIYSAASQQPPPSLPATPIAPNNPSIPLIPSYNIKPTDQTIVAKYNYIKPSSELQAAIVERPKAISTVPALPPVLTITAPSVQNTNTQAYYYNQQLSDPRRNVYYNQKAYPQQSQVTVSTMQSQPTAALLPSPSVLSPFPVSILQAPSLSAQYLFSSGYPNAVLAPVYSSQKSKSTNLKSFLPLIFNLLKEKVNSNECRNSCSCDCKNRTNEIKPEVLSGYSNQKRYGSMNEDTLSLLNTAAEETEGSGCLRERKNCNKEEKDEPEVSDETLEDDDDSDEEEVDDEED